MKLKIFGEPIIEYNTIEQFKRCLLDDSIGVLTADAHLGYSMPIGGAVAYKNHISVSGVGFDIGCGNKAVRTDIKKFDFDKEGVSMKYIMNDIQKQISFGMGRNNNKPVDHEIIDKINLSDIPGQKSLVMLALNQLGTVGGGNHFVDLFTDEDDYIWIGVHFGSRGFGHKTATGFIAMSQGLSFTDRASEGSMDKPPILFDLASQIGEDYFYAMTIAGAYAYAGRDIVVDKVLEILGNPKITLEIHNHHNFAWFEEHFGEEYCVVRKGCTPAFPGQLGFIGANMFDDSYVVEGIDCEDAKEGLYSTVHGAGRILSRTQAAGKKKWIRGEDGKKRPQIIAPGLVDFEETKETARQLSIELRGAGADESPECYKNLQDVLKYQADTIRIKHRLRPIGVCMAGDSDIDPYKD